MCRAALSLIFIVLFNPVVQAQRMVRIRPAVRNNVIVDYPEPLIKAGVKDTRCIFKDSRNFMWIGTANGLYRFDGTNVDLIEHEPGNPRSLPNNTIVSLTEDKNGHIWAGTMMGAASIDPKTLECTIYNKSEGSLTADFDVKVFIGRQGRIWAGTSGGIFLFSPEEHRFRNVWKDGTGKNTGVGYINCLADGKNDTLIAGTFNGIVLLNKKTLRYRWVSPLKEKLTVISLYADEQKVWIGTWYGGLLAGDNSLKNFRQFKWEKADKVGQGNIVSCIIKTKYNGKSAMWASTSHGVYEINTDKTDPAVRITRIASVENGFIKSLMSGSDGRIWEAGDKVSSFFAGSSRFNALPFHCDNYISDIQSIKTGGQPAVAVSGWYGTKGLTIFSANDHKVIYRHSRQPRSASVDVSGVVRDRFGRFWVSTLGGVFLLDKHLRKIVPVRAAAGDYDKLATLRTNAIAICHDTVWVGCYRAGIRLFDLNFHLLKTFRAGDGSDLTDNLLNRFFVSKARDVWVCGDDKLFKYNSRTGKFSVFKLNQYEDDFSPNEMAEAAPGKYVVAARAGLFWFEEANKRFSPILSPLSGREKDAESVCIDKNGDIWYLNNNNLVFYQVRKNHFTHFGPEDGLNIYGQLTCLRTFNGKDFYLAEGSRIVTFSLPASLNNGSPVTLYLHDLQVNDSTLSQKRLQHRLVFRYDENKIGFGFGAINYIKPEQDLYAYQLSGVDKKWVYSTVNNVSYANLAPGDYTFALKAENYAGLWSKPLSIPIQIQHPYWGTWWFRLLSVVLLSAMLLSAIRYVLQRNLKERILLLEKEKAVEQERNRIARDMHDDLGSGLTKIAVLSEVVKTRLAEPQSASSYLDVISAASRELVDNLQGIIWVLNPKNDSVESLVLYLKEYTEGFFEHTPVNLNFTFDGIAMHFSLSEEKRRNIFLVVKECCNNALKHSGCTEVNISVALKDQVIWITIADNGIGFDVKSVPAFSNGLQNMRNRMRQTGGEFQLISGAGTGTVLTCRIPV